MRRTCASRPGHRGLQPQAASNLSENGPINHKQSAELTAVGWVVRVVATVVAHRRDGRRDEAPARVAAAGTGEPARVARFAAVDQGVAEDVRPA